MINFRESRKETHNVISPRHCIDITFRINSNISTTVLRKPVEETNSCISNDQLQRITQGNTRCRYTYHLDIVLISFRINSKISIYRGNNSCISNDQLQRITQGNTRCRYTYNLDIVLISFRINSNISMTGLRKPLEETISNDQFQRTMQENMRCRYRYHLDVVLISFSHKFEYIHI